MQSHAARFSLFCWLVVVLTLAVVLWGAYVRATGSGAGCGNHWPLCNGEVVPRSSASETIIEFTHRLSSGAALLAVVLLAIIAYRLFPKGSLVRVGALLSLCFMLTEALIGAGLVLFGLVAEEDSFARAWVMAFHLVNTFLLLGALVLTAVTASGWIPDRVRLFSSPGALIIATLLGLLLVGASGAVTALGDTLFPAATLSEALSQDFSPNAHLLVRLRIYHPILALACSALVLLTTFRTSGIQLAAAGRKAARLAAVLVVVQLLAGVVNVWLLAPIWLQLVHLLLSDLLWMALVVTALAVSTSLQSRFDPV